MTLMDGSGPEHFNPLTAEVMVQSREDESLPHPALLPLDVSVHTSGLKMQQSVVPLVQSPGRNGLGVIQSPVKTANLPSDNPQKGPLSSLPAAQEAVQTTADTSLMDTGDKSLASEESVLLQTPVKLPKKRGRKTKAELLVIRMAQDLEAQTRVESRQTDSENVEVELTQSGRPRRRAAKTAMMHFQDIAHEWAAYGLSSPPKPDKMMSEETGKRRPRKRKADDSADDVDFVVSEDVMEQEREEVEDDDGASGEESDAEQSFYRTSVFAPGEKVHPLARGSAENGLHNSIMAPVWSSAQITMDFREAQYSDWGYPEWIPNKGSWCFLSRSEAEIYLPLQMTSPPFCIRREGIKEDSDPHVLSR
ncbi:general transcription factor 3C polypeptide 2-like [Rhinoderma darwinii]|uniref:general transcription factor 3C polypeptide 2-like n=1 Tax=Rhinoderma darwinii TaxID=43563 RepID=UPI003F670D2E